MFFWFNGGSNFRRFHLKGKLRISIPLLFLAATMSGKVLAQCQPLADLYPASEQQWPETVIVLRQLMPQCLDSAEYFALLGAAELNTGNLAEALEALERALLIEADYGAAQIDYAQALYLRGQLFAAIELNRAVLARADLPVNLREMLLERARLWGAYTRSYGLVAEVSGGYDSNLNGAPANSELVLTLSGESVTLSLDPRFRPIEGGFANFRLAGNVGQIATDSRHDLVYSLRTRSSTDSESDIIQLDWRYGYTRSLAALNLEFTAGTSHLLYGGSPLYSVFEARSRLKPQRTGCVPTAELAGQYQRSGDDP